ncbi:HlyD family type I secretion periplasmic adaptor subunit [Pseudaquabacterium pictum]|uniref:Membrane fusion protein (MFP) family protein n=1 Tax=Pseudaquabacterium pictum TaxID=2315236 RepID=A0A480AX72_9BURK|nr:HlyD family type I secretion periplasmic adaptor subunit [Rubrivivax pictus]GCL65943.1 HlyD family type I secretion periplasmic adaptor subunit [Rubrivivax pictus]
MAETKPLRRGDMEFLSPLQAAQQDEPAHVATWSVYLMLVALVVAVAWAALAKVDMVTRAESRVIPVGREQVIASLEGGILRELKVREGEAVTAGQPLALLDPTRVEAQQNEGRLKRLALQATVVRLQAEAGGRPLAFPKHLQEVPEVVQGETASYEARRRALNEAVASNQRNQALLEREVAMAQTMSAKGLMSEVEVMRLRRQANDLALVTQERINRFRQDASAELVKAQTELTMLGEQQVVRDDILKRTTLTSPVRGLVKNIRMNTVGGVVSAGAPVMEIVPVDEQVLVELRIKPSDIGWVRVGHPVEIKLSAYDFTIYGSLHGTVDTVSPDALSDSGGPAANAEATWYRALVRADASKLKAGGKPLTVLPGMVGTAEIRTGQRSVLSFLLRPMMKATEAFTER